MLRCQSTTAHHLAFFVDIDENSELFVRLRMNCELFVLCPFRHKVHPSVYSGWSRWDVVERIQGPDLWRLQDTQWWHSGKWYDVTPLVKKTLIKHFVIKCMTFLFVAYVTLPIGLWSDRLTKPRSIVFHFEVENPLNPLIVWMRFGYMEDYPIGCQLNQPSFRGFGVDFIILGERFPLWCYPQLRLLSVASFNLASPL